MHSTRSKRVVAVHLALFSLALLLGTQLRGQRPATEFPHELVEFVPGKRNPVFTAAGAGHWDARIRERGWILKEGDQWRMWYTGYDGTREGQKMLGLATSPDGIRWTRHAIPCTIAWRYIFRKAPARRSASSVKRSRSEARGVTTAASCSAHQKPRMGRNSIAARCSEAKPLDHETQRIVSPERATPPCQVHIIRNE